MRAGPVLQHPGADEIHEKGQCRGRGGCRCGDTAGAQPPGGVLQAAAGWAGGAAHPRRRAAAVSDLRCPGPGFCQKSAGGGRRQRRCAGQRLCEQSRRGARHPGAAAVLCQRAAGKKPAADRRCGGGLPQPAAEGEVPRLCAAHHAAGERGGRERPPGQDGGEIRRRESGVRRGALHRERRAGRRGAAKSGGKALLSDHDGTGIPETTGCAKAFAGGDAAHGEDHRLGTRKTGGYGAGTARACPCAGRTGDGRSGCGAGAGQAVHGTGCAGRGVSHHTAGGPHTGGGNGGTTGDDALPCPGRGAGAAGDRHAGGPRRGGAALARGGRGAEDVYHLRGRGTECVAH